MLLHVVLVQSVCHVMLCYIMFAMAVVVVPCPKNFSAQSDPVSFCASDNKRLVTWKTTAWEEEEEDGVGA